MYVELLSKGNVLCLYCTRSLLRFGRCVEFRPNNLRRRKAWETNSSKPPEGKTRGPRLILMGSWVAVCGRNIHPPTQIKQEWGSPCRSPRRGENQYLEGGNKSQQRAIAGARVATRSEVIGNRWEAPGRVEDDGFPGVRRLRGIRLRGIPRGAVAGRTLGAEGTVGRKVRAIRGPSERFGRVGMSCVTLTQTMRCPSDDDFFQLHNYLYVTVYGHLLRFVLGAWFRLD